MLNYFLYQETYCLRHGRRATFVTIAQPFKAVNTFLLSIFPARFFLSAALFLPAVKRDAVKTAPRIHILISCIYPADCAPALFRDLYRDRIDAFDLLPVIRSISPVTNVAAHLGDTVGKLFAASPQYDPVITAVDFKVL